ncbi:MAG: hypothetical protein ACT4P9_05955 [Betaproteobacteria bacterium]
MSTLAGAAGSPYRELGYHHQMRVLIYLIGARALLTATLIATASAPLVAQPANSSHAVRLSRGGICHDASSSHYSRLKEFQSFKSMDLCIAAGGRPTQGTSRNESRGKPNESLLETWGIALLIAVVIALIVGIPLLRRWWIRRKNISVEKAFREAEARRWEGHRIERPGKDVP